MSLIRRSENLWEFPDTCNVYVLKSGTECLLIDTGSSAVIQHLAAIGIERVDWVLHTHHHRDQCWGTPSLQQAGAKVAVPEYERHLFDNVEAYWQARRVYDNYNDSNTFFSLGENLPVDAVLEDYGTFVWREYQFRILPAKYIWHDRSDCGSGRKEDRFYRRSNDTRRKIISTSRYGVCPWRSSRR
ncbi:MBL fold metallo-hydrolase [Bradyrhizobium huanghuaihaiense]|uniref:MBL fold metallo-hydrolase n=1 Tax=Bradyrhizobium huanghuaihaiense TaxID=990078 RepID=UPI003CC53B84